MVYLSAAGAGPVHVSASLHGVHMEVCRDLCLSTHVRPQGELVVGVNGIAGGVCREAADASAGSELQRRNQRGGQRTFQSAGLGS